MQIEMEQLRKLIGVGVIYRGVECCVIEVLEDGPSLVLENSRAQAQQDNQYGDPGREVPETYTVPVRGESGDLNDEFLRLSVPAGPSRC